MNDITVELKLPINLGLNDGTICPQSCIEVMQQHTQRTDLRHYTTAENEPLLDVICEKDGVNRNNIYLANGSGPILKQCIPWLVSQRIKSSPKLTAKYLLGKNTFLGKTGLIKDIFPVVSGRLTYFKVPLKGMKAGLTMNLLPLGPETNWKLRPEDVADALKRSPSLAYICNPNNPTGLLMLTRAEIVELLEAFPESIFWVDEAYVQYMPEGSHEPLSDLVPKYPNLYVSRTFSFAYGLAGARIGYLLGPSDDISAFKSQVTDYRLGTLQEALAIAALTDANHIADLHKITAADREKVGAVLESFGVEVVPSHTHYILGRFTDSKRTGEWLAKQLLEKGIKIKHFVPVIDENYSEYFRITLGVGAENDYLCEQLTAILSV